MVQLFVLLFFLSLVAYLFAFAHFSQPLKKIGGCGMMNGLMMQLLTIIQLRIHPSITSPTSISTKLNSSAMDPSDQPEKRIRRRGAKARASEEEKPKPKPTEAPLKRKLDQVKNNPAPIPIAVNNQRKDAGKKKKKPKEKAPKEGEPGYLTPSQMRNARKRRAKQKKNVNEAEENADDADADTDQQSNNRKKKRVKANNDDPSSRYIGDPRSAPLVKKAKKYFGGMNIPFVSYVGELSGWRTVSKLPVRRANDKSCVIGLFKPKSHTIVQVPNCGAHHPSINNIIEILQREVDNYEITPYNELDGVGMLRYVCINVERCTGKVQLTLVWNASPYKDGDDGEGKEKLDTFTKYLVAKSDSIKLHSLWVHFNAQSKHADNIFDFGSATDGSRLWKHIHGPKEIVESLDLSQSTTNEVKLHFPPNVFRQANLDAFTKIVAEIRKYVMTYNASRAEKELPTCVELYGGVGTIGLNLCDLTSSFVSSDENPHNKLCFEKSAKLLSSENRKKCTYIPKNATDVIREAGVLSKNCEIIVVDPPRKGLDDYVSQSFIDADGPKLLVYVSCGFDAFMRDCDKLLKSGQWKLDKAEGHLLFPGSDAIETLAFFRRT